MLKAKQTRSCEYEVLGMYKGKDVVCCYCKHDGHIRAIFDKEKCPKLKEVKNGTKK